MTWGMPIPGARQPRTWGHRSLLASARSICDQSTVKLRWKRPDGDVSTQEEIPFADRGGAFGSASADLRFTAAVAAFGMILRGSAEKGDATLPLVARIAGDALGPDAGGYRAEFLDLVRRAQSLREGQP